MILGWATLVLERARTRGAAFIILGLVPTITSRITQWRIPLRRIEVRNKEVLVKLVNDLDSLAEFWKRMAC